MPDKTEMLRKIRDEILSLSSSPLYKERIKNKTFPVIGEGSHNASIMFIGEAPGKNEAETGRPFCGAAGRILDKLLASINLKREAVYVTNIVKDRPPLNRDPLPSEIEAYGPFLDRQIDIIQPKVIATLGRFSMTYIINKFSASDGGSSISKIHGKKIDATASYGPIKIIPLYHPAVAIYNADSYGELEKDFRILKEFID